MQKARAVVHDHVCKLPKLVDSDVVHRAARSAQEPITSIDCVVKKLVEFLKGQDDDVVRWQLKCNLQIGEFVQLPLIWEFGRGQHLAGFEAVRAEGSLQGLRVHDVAPFHRQS